jgi:hypothetical protein
MSKANYLETALLNMLYRTATFTKPTNVYVALYTSDPTDADSGTEVTGGSYARVAVSVADASWSAPADNSGSQRITNAGAITFPAPTANWGTVTHFGIRDASSAGNLLHHGALGTSRTINNGDGAPSFAVGALAIQEG